MFQSGLKQRPRPRREQKASQPLPPGHVTQPLSTQPAAQKPKAPGKRGTRLVGGVRPGAGAQRGQSEARIARLSGMEMRRWAAEQKARSKKEAEIAKKKPYKPSVPAVPEKPSQTAWKRTAKPGGKTQWDRLVDESDRAKKAMEEKRIQQAAQERLAAEKGRHENEKANHKSDIINQNGAGNTMLTDPMNNSAPSRRPQNGSISIAQPASRISSEERAHNLQMSQARDWARGIAKRYEGSSGAPPPIPHLSKFDLDKLRESTAIQESKYMQRAEYKRPDLANLPPSPELKPSRAPALVNSSINLSGGGKYKPATILTHTTPSTRRTQAQLDEERRQWQARQDKFKEQTRRAQEADDIARRRKREEEDRALAATVTPAEMEKYRREVDEEERLYMKRQEAERRASEREIPALRKPLYQTTVIDSNPVAVQPTWGDSGLATALKISSAVGAGLSKMVHAAGEVITKIADQRPAAVPARALAYMKPGSRQEMQTMLRAQRRREHATQAEKIRLQRLAVQQHQNMRVAQANAGFQRLQQVHAQTMAKRNSKNTDFRHQLTQLQNARGTIKPLRAVDRGYMANASRRNPRASNYSRPFPLRVTGKDPKLPPPMNIEKEYNALLAREKAEKKKAAKRRKPKQPQSRHGSLASRLGDQPPKKKKGKRKVTVLGLPESPATSLRSERMEADFPVPQLDAKAIGFGGAGNVSLAGRNPREKPKPNVPWYKKQRAKPMRGGQASPSPQRQAVTDFPAVKPYPKKIGGNVSQDSWNIPARTYPHGHYQIPTMPPVRQIPKVSALKLKPGNRQPKLKTNLSFVNINQLKVPSMGVLQNTAYQKLQAKTKAKPVMSSPFQVQTQTTTKPAFHNPKPSPVPYVNPFKPKLTRVDPIIVDTTDPIRKTKPQIPERQQPTALQPGAQPGTRPQPQTPGFQTGARPQAPKPGRRPIRRPQVTPGFQSGATQPPRIPGRKPGFKPQKTKPIPVSAPRPPRYLSPTTIKPHPNRWPGPPRYPVRVASDVSSPPQLHHPSSLSSGMPLFGSQGPVSMPPLEPGSLSGLSGMSGGVPSRRPARSDAPPRRSGEFLPAAPESEDLPIVPGVREEEGRFVISHRSSSESQPSSQAPPSGRPPRRRSFAPMRRGGSAALAVKRQKMSWQIIKGTDFHVEPLGPKTFIFRSRVYNEGIESQIKAILQRGKSSSVNGSKFVSIGKALAMIAQSIASSNSAKVILR